MPHSIDSTDPAAPEVPDAMHHELHGRGRAFGLEYEIGIRVWDLSEAALKPYRAPLAAPEPRLALAAAVEGAEEPAPEGVGRWEWEGGMVA